METAFAYSYPVNRLLTIPEYSGGYRFEEWPDYVDRYGLTAEHVPELIRLASDIDTFWQLPDEEDPAAFAPLHAVRALGQLRDPRAVEPLLALIVYDDEAYGGADFMTEIIPQAVGLIGAPALELLREFLADDTNPLWPRVYMDGALPVMASVDPEMREACVKLASDRLANYERQDSTLNGSYVTALIDLKAVEAVDLIEEAMASGHVDESMNGDWEDVQIELGLLTERVTPRPNYFFNSRLAREAAEADKTARARRRIRQTFAKKKKQKRKKKRRR